MACLSEPFPVKKSSRKGHDVCFGTIPVSFTLNLPCNHPIIFNVCALLPLDYRLLEGKKSVLCFSYIVLQSPTYSP